MSSLALFPSIFPSTFIITFIAAVENLAKEFIQGSSATIFLKSNKYSITAFRF